MPFSNEYSVDYTIKNNSNEVIDICFAPEQIFAFSSKTGDDFRDLKNVNICKRYDYHLKIELEIKFSDKSELFVYPVETVANSDDGYEKTYQGTAVAPIVECNISRRSEKVFFENDCKF